MKVGARDKQFIMIGGIAAVAILVLGYVVFPVMRKWSSMGDSLEPKLSQMERLRERVAKQDALRTRRDVLIKRMGYLEEPPPAPPEEKGDKEAKGPKPPAPPGPANNPEADRPMRGDAPPGANGEPKSNDSDKGAPSGPPVSPNGIYEPEHDGGPPSDAQFPMSPDAGPPPGEVPKPPQEGPVSTEGDKKPEGADKAEGDKQPKDAGKAKGEKKPEEADKVEEKPKDPAGVSVAAYIQTAAGKAGVKITRITPRRRASGAKSGKYFRAESMQISVEGNIKNVIALLHALEKGDRFVRVEQFQLRRDIKQAAKVDATLDLMAYEATGKGA